MLSKLAKLQQFKKMGGFDLVRPRPPDQEPKKQHSFHHYLDDLNDAQRLAFP